MASLDLALVADELKAHYKDSPGFISKILLSGDGDMATIEIISDVRDTVVISDVSILSFLKPASDDFSPTENAVKIKTRLGQIKNIDGDLKFVKSDIDRLQRSYKVDVSAGALDPTQMPFLGYFTTEIQAKGKSDIRKARWRAVKAVTPTTVFNSFDGYLEIVKKEVASDGIPAGNVYSAAAGAAAITSANAMDQLRAIAKLLNSNEDLLEQDFLMYVSPVVFTAYCEDYQASVGAAIYNTTAIQMGIDILPNVKLIREPAMGATNRVIMTPAKNLKWLVGDLDNLGTVDVQKINKQLNLMLQTKCAPEIGIPEWVFTNNYVGIV